jgi:hypothetical protein
VPRLLRLGNCGMGSVPPKSVRPTEFPVPAGKLAVSTNPPCVPSTSIDKLRISNMRSLMICQIARL